MLVLTRKIQQSIAIGDPINSGCLLTITVLGIGSGNVKLGFEADPSVPVHRGEVWDRLRAGSTPDGSADGLETSIVR